MHVVGPYARYHLRETRTLTPPEGIWEDYLRLADTLGLNRNVIVQPSFFAKDNGPCSLGWHSWARRQHPGGGVGMDDTAA